MFSESASRPGPPPPPHPPLRPPRHTAPPATGLQPLSSYGVRSVECLYLCELRCLRPDSSFNTAAHSRGAAREPAPEPARRSSVAEDRPVQLTAVRRPARNLRDALRLPAPGPCRCCAYHPKCESFKQPRCHLSFIISSHVISSHVSFIIILEVKCLKPAHYPACHTPHHLTHLQVAAWDTDLPNLNTHLRKGTPKDPSYGEPCSAHTGGSQVPKQLRIKG